MLIISHYEENHVRVLIKKGRWRKWKYLDLTHKEFHNAINYITIKQYHEMKQQNPFISNLEMLRQFLLTFNESEIDRFFMMIKLDN